jgi:hypothetical protein
MALAQRVETTDTSTWADLSGRWFFAWRMAAACESALREVAEAHAGQEDPARQMALAKVSSLLHDEMTRWVRRGEALDMIVERVPRAE